MKHKYYLCPRCKTPLTLMIESEHIGSERRITYKYRCSACSFKVVTERVILRKVNGSFRLEILKSREIERIYQ
ncbi:MAG: hypothetical protein DRO15_02690 [Thermoprotei archaeon]|nr:MAG: hypothetical protein DRO15_02690 [Thermoprotei archaeon]